MYKAHAIAGFHLETMEMEKHQLEVMPVDALLEEEDPPESPIRPTASMGYAVDPVKHLHYFFGGIFKGTDPLTGKVIKFLSNRLHVYNSETEELEVLQEDPASPMPSPRISAALTFVPALRKISATPMLYLFGGNDGSASSCESLGEFWSFNLETRFWHRIHEYDPICGLREGLTMDYWKRPDDGDHNRSSKSTMESPSVHFLALYGGSTGEKNGNFKHRDLLLYDIVKDKFSKPSCQVSPPLGRCYHSSFLLGSRLVIFGGWQQTPEALNHYYDKSANHYKVTNSLCSITLGTDFVKYNDLGRDLPDSSKPCPRTTQSMTLCNRVGLLFGGIREEMIDGSAKNSPLSDIWVLEVGAPVRAISLVLNRDTLVWEDPLSWIPSRTYRILIGKDPAKYPDAASSRKEVVYEGKNTSWKVQGLQEGVSYMATLDIVTPTAVTEGSNACFFLHIGEQFIGFVICFFNTCTEPPKPPSEIQSSISGDAFYFSWPRIPGCRYVVDVKVASLATDRLESRYSRKDKDKEEISSFAFEHDAGTADTWHGSVEQIKSRLSPTFRSTRIQLVVRVLAVNRFKEASEWSAPSELILDLTPEVVIMPSAVREPLAKATQLKAPLRKPGTLDAVDVEMEEILVEGSSVRPQETFDSMEVVEELVTEGVSARPVGDVTEVMKGSSVLPVEEGIVLKIVAKLCGSHLLP